MIPFQLLRLTSRSNECKRRKIKCNGESPCHRCGNLSLECLYAPNCCSSGFKDSEYALSHTFLSSIAAIDTSTENFDRSMRTSPRFKNKLIRSIPTSMHYMAVKTTAFQPSTRTYTLDMNLAPFPCLRHLYQIRGRPLVCAGSIPAFRVPPARPSTSMLPSPAFRQWVSPDRKTAWMKGSRREMLHRSNRHAQRQAQQWRYIHLRILCGY